MKIGVECLNKYKSIALAIDHMKQRIMSPTSDVGSDLKTDDMYQTTGAFSKYKKSRAGTGHENKKPWERPLEFGDKNNDYIISNEGHNTYQFPQSTKGNRLENIKNTKSNINNANAYYTSNDFYKNNNLNNSNYSKISQSNKERLPQIKNRTTSKIDSNNSTKFLKSGNNFVPHSLLSALATDIQDSRNTNMVMK